METDEKTGEKKNRHADIENLGFVFDIDGYKIFHCGDTNPWNEKEYKTFNLQEEHIDLAFLERLFMVGKGQTGINIIEKYIQPKQIILMHITPTRKESFKNLVLISKERLPDIHIFDKQMDKKSF